MRSSRLQKFICNGPISQNVSLKVISNVAKFHAFIIKLNNSMFFWSITAGLFAKSHTITILSIQIHCSLGTIMPQAAAIAVPSVICH